MLSALILSVPLLVAALAHAAPVLPLSDVMDVAPPDDVLDGETATFVPAPSRPPAPSRHDVPPGAAYVAIAPAIEPIEQGIRALADSLRDDEELRRLLGPILALRDASVETESEDDAPQAAALGADVLGSMDARLPGSDATQDALRDRPDGARPGRAVTPQTRGNRSSTALDEGDFGVTLRDAARFVVTRHRDEKRRTRTDAEAIELAASDVDEDIDNASLTYDIVNGALESRLLGEALVNVIERSKAPGDENAFSILGLGRFELDMAPDLRDISVSELTTGATIGFAQADDSIDYSGGNTQPQQQPREPPQQVHILLLALNLLLTPIGTITTVVVGVLFLIWGMVKFAKLLHRN